MVVLVILTAIAGFLLALAIYVGWAEGKVHRGTTSSPSESAAYLDERSFEAFAAEETPSVGEGESEEGYASDAEYPPEEQFESEWHRSLTGTARADLAEELAAKYKSGVSIRELAEETGRPYGFVHRMLSEAGVTLRGRGGVRSGRKQRSSRRASGSVREEDTEDGES